jgi:hypothetical protein
MTGLLSFLLASCGATTEEDSPTHDAGSGSQDAGSTGGGGNPGTGGYAGTGGASTGGASAEAGDDALSADDAGEPDDAGSVFPCLPNGEEKLVIQITGTPSLDITTPKDATCLSRYHAANDESGALLDLFWAAAETTISVVVRMNDVTPGQTGTFPPFAFTISRSSDSWLGLPDKCHVSLTTSEKIGSTTQFPGSIYKVAGTIACDSGWALGQTDAILRKFEFATRVTSPDP